MCTSMHRVATSGRDGRPAASPPRQEASPPSSTCPSTRTRRRQMSTPSGPSGRWPRGRRWSTSRSGVGSSRRTPATSGRSWTPAWWASRRSCATAGGPNSPPATPTRWPGAWRRRPWPGFRWRSTARSRPSSWAGGSERPVASEVAAVAQAGASAVAHGARLHVVHCSSPDAVLEAKRWAAHDGRDLPPLPGAQPGRRAAGSAPTRPAALPSAGRAIAGAWWRSPPTAPSTAWRRTIPPARRRSRTDRAPSPACRRCRDDALGPALPGVSGSPVAPRHRAAPRRGRGAVRTGAQGRGRTGIRRRSGPRRRRGATWTVAPESLHSRHRRSPFLGRALPGVVVATIVGGVVVYEAGGQAAEPSGRFLTPGVPGRNPREKERSS